MNKINYNISFSKKRLLTQDEVFDITMMIRLPRWYWKDNSGLYEPYREPLCYQFLKNLELNQFQLQYTEKHKYQVDLKANVQRNIKSNKIRKIRSEESLRNTMIWPINFPKPSVSDQENHLQMNTLQEDHIEFKNVKKLFHRSMPMNPVVSVQKITHHHLRFQFETELEALKKKYHKAPYNNLIRHLFHGTSRTDPMKIYNSEKGFLIQFSSIDNKWGSGVYFAENASYSGRKYSYKPPNQTTTTNTKQYQMLLAEVIVGNVFYSDKPTIFKVPPTLPTGVPWQKFEDERYDSVCGLDHGSKIYVVYENSRAYPAYLITYSKEETVKK